MQKKPRGGPRLPPAAQRLILEACIAGCTNKQILQKLHDAGYPADISRQALSLYRADPQVSEALKLLDEETKQAGLAVRARRIQSLSLIADNLQQRLLDNPIPLNLLEFREYCVGADTFTRMMAELTRLVDGPAGTAAGGRTDPTKPQDAPEAPLVPFNAQTLFNDMLALYLEERGVAVPQNLLPPGPRVVKVESTDDDRAE